MSFFGTFIKSVENAIKKLFGEATSDLQKAQSAISFAAPVVTLLVTETAGPEYGADVANVLTEIKTDMGTASATIANAHSASDPTTLQIVSNSISSINTNLSALLSAGHIKNTTTQAKVTAVIGEFAAVLGQLVAAQSAPAAGNAGAAAGA